MEVDKFYTLAPILTLIMLFSTPTEATLCNNGKAADIVFVIDSSNSIWRPDFPQLLKFVENIVDHFKIREDAVRVGAVTFSHKVRLDFHLNHYTTKESLKQAIMNIPFLGGSTDTAKAIKFAREEMFKRSNGARPSASHIIVVITDGYSVDSAATAMEAHISRYEGITLFAVGVGVSNHELNLIASKPEASYVYMVHNFTGLNQIHETIANTACIRDDKERSNEVIDPEQNDEARKEKIEYAKRYCGGKPADVYVVLDSSNSIWEPHFYKELNFTIQLVDIFDISEDHTRVGVIQYSDGIHNVIPLDNGYDKDVLKTKISQLTRITGGTNTGSVIDFITEQAFDSSVSRPNINAAQVVLILTDGQSFDPERTALAAKKAHARGIYLFAIGIGSETDTKELNAIASDPDSNFVFEVDSFKALDSVVDILAIKTCEAEGVLSDIAIKSGPPVDMVFAYDSYSFGQKKSTAIRKSIAKLLSATYIHLADFKVGVMSKVCTKEKDIKLNENKLSSKLTFGMEYDGVDKLLRKVRRHGYQRKNGGRNGAKKVAVIFLDENVYHPEKVIHQAKRTAFKVELFVVNIGQTLSKDFLVKLCSRPSDDHLINVPTYADLPNALHKIIKKLRADT